VFCDGKYDLCNARKNETIDNRKIPLFKEELRKLEVKTGVDSRLI